ncbi:c-type cytochrome [bacterium]|nr:c-type cytochrome [bacterium]
MKHVFIGFLVGAFLFTALVAGAATPLKVEAPKGLNPIPIPANNEMTEEKVKLGKFLFFEKRLSKDKTLSCATCHIPKHGYAEPKPTSEGIKGQLGGRNANPVVNSAYASSLFWDGRAADLEEQAAGPVENPIEMGHSMVDVVAFLKDNDAYVKMFKSAFPPEGKINKETVTKAIAAFERTILSGNSPYDKGELSADAKKGQTLFMGKGLCSSCHTPPVFSNWGFYNAGVGMDAEKPDLGRYDVTKQDADKGAFRVPHLREAANTAPYFHDGSAETLEDAVRFMAQGGKDNPNLHALFRAVKAQTFSDAEIKQLVAFLKALSGEYPIIEEPELP